jgi:hypothetical protein
VNCDDVDRTLSGRSADSWLPLDAQEHVRSCKPCQELVRLLGTPVPPDQPSSNMLGQIEQRLTSDWRAVRPMASARCRFFIFLGVFASAASAAIWGLGPSTMAVMSPLQATIILGALAVNTGLLAYSLVCQMAPGSRHRISPRWLPVATVISLTAAVAILFQFERGRDFWAQAWTCLRTGTPIGCIAAVPFWLVLRRGAVLSPAMTGAATGLLAGLVGTSVLEIHCLNLGAWHILASHVGAAVLCSLAGLTLGLVSERRSDAGMKR